MFEIEIIYHTCDGGPGWCNSYAIGRDQSSYYVFDSAEENIVKFDTLAQALDNCAEICQPTSRLLKGQLATVVEEFTKQIRVSEPTCVSGFYNEVADTEAVLSLLPQNHKEAIRYIAKEIGLNRPEWTIPELKSLDDALHLWCKSTTDPVKTQVPSFDIKSINHLDDKIQRRMLQERVR